MKPKGIKTSVFGTPFKKPKKEVESLEQRRKTKESLKVYNIYTGGGDDCA